MGKNIFSQKCWTCGSKLVHLEDSSGVCDGKDGYKDEILYFRCDNCGASLKVPAKIYRCANCGYEFPSERDNPECLNCGRSGAARVVNDD